MKKEKTRLEQQINFILMRAGVTGPEIDQCIHWAFGPNAWYIPVMPEWIERWNKLHGRLMHVKKSDSFVEFMYNVGYFFMQYKKDKAQGIVGLN